MKNGVIHITHIPFHFQCVFYIVIKIIQIYIGQKLACQIADRQTMPSFAMPQAFMGGDFREVGAGLYQSVFCGIIEDNLPCQPGHKRIAANFSFDNFHKI